MRSQCLCNITYTAALLTHSLYGLPVLVMQTLVLSFRHVLCSFPSSFAFMVKKISVSEFLRSARSSFLLFPIKKENRQRLYNLLSIFILKLILFADPFTDAPCICVRQWITDIIDLCSQFRIISYIFNDPQSGLS